MAPAPFEKLDFARRDELPLGAIVTPPGAGLILLIRRGAIEAFETALNRHGDSLGPGPQRWGTNVDKC